jgi:GNAT superfamily N-acetyltransferase
MDVEIRPLLTGDRPAVTRLLDEAVGAGFWSFIDGREGLSLVAVSRSGVAGVVLARLTPAGDADARTALRPEAAAAGGPILHVRAIAVAPESRGVGLARRLLARVEDEARERGAGAAFLYAWLPAGQPEPDATRFYAAMGYEAGADIEGFYAGGSVAAGACCPFCGEPPCRCAARPFGKRLRG